MNLMNATKALDDLEIRLTARGDSEGLAALRDLRADFVRVIRERDDRPPGPGPKSSRPLISPCDCKHHRTAFIQSGQGAPPAYREHAEICRDCGQFLVTAWKGGVSFRITFTLATPESVAAAGRYLQYLESEGG